MIRGVLIFIISWSTTAISHSQTAPDAIRLGFNQYINSARSAGVGGAFGSLGADISVANINPAGIAEFRKSEVVLGANYWINNNQSNFNGNNSEVSDSKVQLGTIAGVFNWRPDNFNTKTMNFAIGINQLASFNDNFSYEGMSSGTIVDRWLDRAFEDGPLRPEELDPFETGPAFDAGALVEIGETGEYFNDDFGRDVPITQQLFRSETITRSGYLNEVFLTLASNYKNKISWGVTLGVPFFRFEETKSYTEINESNPDILFNELVFNQNLELTGTGINLKAGLIYKVTPQLRVGASIHSPTVFAVSDNFETDLIYDYAELVDGEFVNFFGTGTSGLSPFDYQILTPWRALLGLSYLYKIGELKGFISGDLEFVNYGNTQYSPAEDAPPGDEVIFAGVNQFLGNEGASAMNVRLGTEIAYNHFRVRVGATINGGLYSDDNPDSQWNPQLGFSGGIGYRAQTFYIDAAYSIRSTERNYQPYGIDSSRPQQNVNLDSTLGVASLTIGFKI